MNKCLNIMSRIAYMTTTATSSKIAAGLIIFRKLHEQIEYLLLQTSYGAHHWTPPKGHLDEGESEIETAIRETREESGLENNTDYKIIDLKHKIELRYPVNGKQKIVYYWLAHLHNPNSEVKLSDEHIAFKWSHLKAACELVQFNDMKSALEETEEYLKVNNYL